MRRADRSRRGPNVLAIVTARGRSNALPRKNILPLGGRPLIAYSVAACLAAESVHRTIVSTDDAEIASVALGCGAEVPFLRPRELAEDDTPDWPVLYHTVTSLYKLDGWWGDVIVHVRPTVPLRRAGHIDRAVEYVISQGLPGLRTVSHLHTHPYWTVTLEDGRLKPFVPSPRLFTRRQDLPVAYWVDGVVDVTRWETVVDEKRVFGEEVFGLEVNPVFALDIHTETDLRMIEALLRDRDFTAHLETIPLFVSEVGGMRRNGRLSV